MNDVRIDWNIYYEDEDGFIGYTYKDDNYDCVKAKADKMAKNGRYKSIKIQKITTQLEIAEIVK